MKIEEVLRRRKSLVALRLSPPPDPQEFGAEVDAVGLPTVDSEVFRKSGYKAGDELPHGEFESLIHDSACSRALHRAYWYLERYDCSEKQMVIKLRRSFPDYAAAFAAQKCAEQGFIDDSRYAARLAENYITVRHMSRREAQAKLYTKGIPSDIAKAAVAEIECDPVENIKEIIEKKYKNRLADKRQRANTVAALARKGYSYGDIKTALAEYGAEEDQEFYGD